MNNDQQQPHNNVVIAQESTDHGEPKQKQTIKQLAYGGAWGGANTNPGLFRNDRGLPFFRAGKPVTVVPQFKGLTIYSPINTNLPGNSFRNTITGTAVTYPFIAK
jgi:hypothetical protein